MRKRENMSGGLQTHLDKMVILLMHAWQAQVGEKSIWKYAS